MTTLVALVDGDTAYLACDRQSSYGSTRARDSECKYFEKRGVIIAASGAVRMAQIMQFDVNLPAYDDRQTIEQYLWQFLVEPFRKALKDADYAESDDGKQSSGGALFALYRGEAYYICSDFSLMRVRDFETTGTGWQFATGSLDTTVGLSPRERLEKAIATASRYDLYTGGGCDIVESKRAS